MDKPINEATNFRCCFNIVYAHGHCMAYTSPPPAAEPPLKGKPFGGRTFQLSKAVTHDSRSQPSPAAADSSAAFQFYPSSFHVSHCFFVSFLTQERNVPSRSIFPFPRCKNQWKHTMNTTTGVAGGCHYAGIALRPARTR